MTIQLQPRSLETLRTTCLGLGFGALLAFAPAAMAQDAQPQAQPDAQAQTDAQAQPDASTVIATVAGETITEGDLAFAAEDLQQELQNIPQDQRRAFLVSVLIDMKLLAGAAREADMAETEAFQRRLSYLEDRALRRAYFSDVIAAEVTPEAVQAAYDELMADFEPQEEIRARHILVPSQELAESVKAEIEGGKPFEIAAMENSTDGSAQNGGDLGYFTRGMMVPAFEEAAFALETGEVSDPVQSQFGWHLIKVEDSRESAPPPLEQVQAQVQQRVLAETFNETVESLKADAEVTINDPELAAAVRAAQGEEEPQAGEENAAEGEGN